MKLENIGLFNRLRRLAHWNIFTGTHYVDKYKDINSKLNILAKISLLEDVSFMNQYRKHIIS